MKINIWVLLSAVIIAYFLYQIRGDIIQHKELSSEKSSLISRLKQISVENNDLANSIAKAKDIATIERLARERLNMIKKGETAFKICQ